MPIPIPILNQGDVLIAYCRRVRPIRVDAVEG